MAVAAKLPQDAGLILCCDYSKSTFGTIWHIVNPPVWVNTAVICISLCWTAIRAYCIKCTPFTPSLPRCGQVRLHGCDITNWLVLNKNNMIRNDTKISLIVLTDSFIQLIQWDVKLPLHGSNITVTATNMQPKKKHWSSDCCYKLMGQFQNPYSQ